MKKIILSMFFVACGLLLFAQNDNSYKVTSTGSYPAYNVPNNIRMNFQNNYPGAMNVAWEPMSMGWRATYNTNNRLMHVYYNPAGINYVVALPVIHNQIPEDVITKMISQYGNSFYDITMMKSAGNKDVYQVRLAENGNIRSVWINGDGSEASDVFVQK